MLLYYLLRQYPNRGDYETNDNVATMVAIQTHDPIKANFIALTKGIYFDGIAKGIDCSCCEDRWIALTVKSKGYNIPKFKNMTLVNYLKEWVEQSESLQCQSGHTLAYIYYADGTKEAMTVGNVRNRYHFFKFQHPS